MILEKIRGFNSELELNEQQRKLFQITRFLMVITFLGIVLRFLLGAEIDTNVIQEIYALLLGIMLSMIFELEIEGIYIILEENIYAIVQDCLGWKSMYLLTSLYLATPNKYLENIKYLFIGLLILQISNIVRIITTILLSEAGILSFEVIHSFLWQWGLSVVVFVLWYYWYTKILGK